MTSPYRRRRGAQTQAVVADYFRDHGWPHVQDAGAGRPGTDLLGVPGLDVEIRARREMDLIGWLRSVARRARLAKKKTLPVLAVRPDGFGPESVEDWPVVLRLADAVSLLRAAGYGDPQDQCDG